MNTTRAMASLARSNPVDARTLASKGRSPEAQAALLGIFAAPAQSSAAPSPRAQGVSPSGRALLLLTTVALLAVALLMYELPREHAPSLSPGPSVAVPDQQGPADTEGRAWTELPPSVYAPTVGDPGYRSPTPTLTPPGPHQYALLPPGSAYLLAQIGEADIVAVGTIAETSSTASGGPNDPGYTTFRLEPAEILLGQAAPNSGAGVPAPGEESPAEDGLLFRAVGSGVEDIGYRGGLSLGDQVVFLGTRRYPLGESTLPGFWLLLGDYSAFRKEGGVFTRLAPVPDDPMGNSFALPELEEVLERFPTGRRP